MGGLPPFHVALTWGGRTLRSGVSASWSQPSYCGGCGASSGAGGAADARRAPVRIARLRRHAAGGVAATADHSPKNTGLKRPARRKGVRIGRILPFRHFSTGMPGSLPEKKRFPAATPRRMAPVHGQRQGRHLPQARSGMRLRSRRRHAAHKIAGGRNNFRRETLSLPRNQAHTQCPDFFTSFFSG